MKKHLFGILIFALLFASIFYIIFFEGFSTINDFFTSIFMLIGFIIAFIIYLTNQNIIPNRFVMRNIRKMPDFVPFKHTFEKYLSKLVKKKVQIIVLIRPIDIHNYEWVLNQVSAYNYIMQTPPFTSYKDKIKFLFIKNNQDDINHLIENLDLAHHNYILLSSINDENIQDIIDKDNNIIRIFPPDYDEAKTAINFMFSKIKNSICPLQECDLYNQTHNIIIIHNGTYGNAIRKQCKKYFDAEFANLDIHTSSQISASKLTNSIKFHSFNYQNNNKLTSDKTQTERFMSFLSETQNDHNHFYIVGYEPNISNMIQHLDESFQKTKPTEFSLLFAGTLSMNSWRKSVIDAITKSKSLKLSLNNGAYYMKLFSIKSIDNLQKESIAMDLKLEHYNPSNTNIKTDLIEELKELFPKRHITEHTNRLNTIWRNENNYITTFSSYSLRIADYSINYRRTLLESKFEVLRDNNRNTDILVNGDSINQYSIKRLEL